MEAEAHDILEDELFLHSNDEVATKLNATHNNEIEKSPPKTIKLKSKNNTKKESKKKAQIETITFIDNSKSSKKESRTKHDKKHMKREIRKTKELRKTQGLISDNKKYSSSSSKGGQNAKDSSVREWDKGKNESKNIKIAMA